MRKSSSALAILLISVMAVGTIDAQPTVTGYLQEGRNHFGASELSQAWDAFKMAENFAIANNDFGGQLSVIDERIKCAVATADPHYKETFGQEAYDVYEKLLQSAIEKTRDPNTADQGLSELGALAGIPIPDEPFGFRDSILASRRDALNALAAGGAGSSWWYCPCGDGAVFYDWAAFDAHWSANHPNGCVQGTAGYYPQTLHECENGGSDICGTWTLQGNQYIANWDNGATATLNVESWGASNVILTRNDAGGSSAGLSARYEGQINGNKIENGKVTWTLNGNTWSGTWNANW